MIPKNSSGFPAHLLLLIFLFSTACQQAVPTIVSPSLSSLQIAKHTPFPKGDMDRDLAPDQVLPSPTPVIVKNLSESPVPTPISYVAQPGDTLKAVAARYSLSPQDITSPDHLPETGFLIPGQFLILPPHLYPVTNGSWLLPDSEIVYSPTVQDFNIAEYIKTAGGVLAEYQEWLESSGWTSSADVVQRVALENSINPRLLIALLEWECGCVSGDSLEGLENRYVLGVKDYHRKSLYGQLSWAAHNLAEGYYAWRSGGVSSIEIGDGSILNPEPDLNAGTVALMTYFSILAVSANKNERVNGDSSVKTALDPQKGFSNLYQKMFGDPWKRDQQAGGLFPPGIQQPQFLLPFEPGQRWSFISGPHPAWENAGAFSALDFAPAANEPGCVPSSAWVIAVANGVVVRSKYGLVVLDLDEQQGEKELLSDGNEATGWAILYLHIGEEGRVANGVRLKAGDPIGHPSCEGGPSTGTHFHIARKYNGEWLAADGPLPFNLGGWTAHAGKKSYEGSLTREEFIIPSSLYGTSSSIILRPKDGEVFP